MNVALPSLLPILTTTRPDGVVLSASQMDTFDLCQRKWAWQYIAGIPSVPNASAKLGIAIHKVLEQWLSRATPIDTKKKAGRVAAKMIKHLPPPGVAEVERRFYLTTRHGHHYTGFIDFSFDGRLYSVADFPLPLIGDHKSTGDLKYAKSEFDLHNNVQAVLYAIAGFIGFNTEVLDLFWNYGTTKDRDPVNHVVRPRVYLPVVTEKFENVIEPLASVIVSHHHARPHPLSFPPSPSACDAFGGCPHRHLCNLTDQERLHATMNAQPNMSERMQQYPANGFAPPQFAPQQQAPVFQPSAQQPQFAPQQTFVQPVQQQPTGFAPQAPQQFQTPSPLPGPMSGFGYPPPAAQPFQPSNGASYQAPPGAPQQTLPFQQPAGSFQPQGAPQQAQPAPYSPESGPNPPESGRTSPQTRAPEPSAAQGSAEGATEGEPKKTRGKGRPPGSPNKELGLEGSIFMGGVYAALANPNFTTRQGAPAIQLLHGCGEAALAAYKAKFG